MRRGLRVLVPALLVLVPASGSAAPVPHRPDPAVPVAQQCARAVDLTVERYGCVATAVPTSDLADLLADREWAFLLAAQLEQAEAERSGTRPVWTGVVIGVPVGVTLAVAVGAAVALKQR